MTMYKIVRFYERDACEDIGIDGLTLEEAQAYCKDKEGSSKTCTTHSNKKRTELCGNWFEGYTEES